MRTLIDDLLAFSRVMRTLEPFVEVDLAQIAREVLGDLEVRLEKSGGAVEVGELPSMEADPTQMRQLLLNLIGNALKFQPPAASPWLRCSGRKLRLDAPGRSTANSPSRTMASGSRSSMRRRYSRCSNGCTGAASMKERASAWRFAAGSPTGTRAPSVARSQPGQGATFIVTLPVRQTKPKTAPMRELPKTNAVILLAEDDSDDRLLVQDAVAECGWGGELRCVENGEELLDYLSAPGQVQATPAARRGQG